MDKEVPKLLKEAGIKFFTIEDGHQVQYIDIRPFFVYM